MARNTWPARFTAFVAGLAALLLGMGERLSLFEANQAGNGLPNTLMAPRTLLVAVKPGRHQLIQDLFARISQNLSDRIQQEDHGVFVVHKDTPAHRRGAISS